MKIKYFYQQLLSHVGVIVIAILILSLLFSHFIENLIYQDKIDELTAYGKNVLADLEQNYDSESILQEYGHVLAGRDIQYSLFDPSSAIIYSTGRGARIKLEAEEWEKIRDGYTVVVKQDYKRFNEGVTFVLLPYLRQGQFVGGILLASPIKGSRDIISQINQDLFYTALVAVAVALLLSWILSAFHVRRIKRLQEATSLIAKRDYSVRIPSSDFDEIGELSKDFNQMVGTLERSMEEIERLENRRRQFMADVSHELRTPLTTIRGVIDGIRNQMIPETEKERAMLMASQETKRLIRLVNENLDYEKIRSNQIKLHKENLLLSEVMEVIRDQLEIQAEEKDNQIILEVDNDVQVYADYDRLTQILINITKNSIQFTEKGIITLRGRMAEGKTVIEIEDNGIGMDPREIKKIWHRFYKAMVSRTNNPYGEFGLGLSIVKQLVQLHDGQIDVESEQGEGTIFTLIFPFGK
ncbi:sensor histidine kinase [Lederbergia galactosidilytica]|uniref:histidine kinase n=1 Tax=Lederbergia galactosidilytica TaxID=217031 RepID=A0A0Q9Y6U6_9BACI|nr:HAMP domain-containing sensor histidine kinase [Lederbergia galactosidilytica]KRG12734.1 histidine kinase [Lederbergia galactosidilytica]OAK73862.1 histidine kinase [Lederbergia galactosidilytica]